MRFVLVCHASHFEFSRSPLLSELGIQVKDALVNKRTDDGGARTPSSPGGSIVGFSDASWKGKNQIQWQIPPAFVLDALHLPIPKEESEEEAEQAKAAETGAKPEGAQGGKELRRRSSGVVFF